MQTEFARWYSSVGLGDDASLREARWQGISAFASDAGSDDIEALTRVAFRTRKAPSPTALEKLKEAFKGSDDTFEISRNARAMEELAGACLAVLMKKGDRKSTRLES